MSRFSIPRGIIPESFFEESLRICKWVNRVSSYGMIPYMLLFDRSSCSKSVQYSISEFIVPFIWFEWMLRALKLVKPPKNEGIDTLRL